MFGGEALVAFAQRQALGGLNEATAAFGEMLEFHLRPLSQAVWATGSRNGKTSAVLARRPTTWQQPHERHVRNARIRINRDLAHGINGDIRVADPQRQGLRI